MRRRRKRRRRRRRKGKRTEGEEEDEEEEDRGRVERIMCRTSRTEEEVDDLRGEGGGGLRE